MQKTYQSREIIRMLKDDGWKLDRVRGSHHQFTHPTKKGVVSVQQPVKYLSAFVVKSMFKQAGWKK